MPEKVHEPLKQVAKRLPEIKDAMQRHHDHYLNLKPEEIKPGDEAQIELARQREVAGEVKPLTPPEQKPQG